MVDFRGDVKVEQDNNSIVYKIKNTGLARPELFKVLILTLFYSKTGQKLVEKHSFLIQNTRF